jgi:hypothetical protein
MSLLARAFRGASLIARPRAFAQLAPTGNVTFQIILISRALLFGF